MFFQGCLQRAYVRPYFSTTEQRRKRIAKLVRFACLDHFTLGNIRFDDGDIKVRLPVPDKKLRQLLSALLKSSSVGRARTVSTPPVVLSSEGVISFPKLTGNLRHSECEGREYALSRAGKNRTSLIVGKNLRAP